MNTTTDTMTSLLGTLDALWPDSTGAELVRTRRGSSEVGSHYLVVPNASRPRLLVPADDPQAAAKALRRFSSSLTLAEAGQRLAFSVALRVAGRRALADRVVIRDADVGDSLQAHLGDVLGEPVRFSLGIGTARANQKPVLQIFGRGGKCLAFAKLGESDTSWGDVSAEIDALQQLAYVEPRRIEIPRLLHHGWWNQTLIMLMSPLETRALSYRHSAPPRAAMSELHGCLGTTRGCLAESPWWQRILQATSAIIDDDRRIRLEEALHALLARSGDNELTFGAWHGDWTPWNMAQRGRRTQLWDWERFETGVPAGLDLCHYGVNLRCRERGASVDSILSGLTWVGSEREPVSGAPVGTLYLAAATTRYLARAQSALGERISERAELFLSTLRLCLDLPMTNTDGQVP